MSILNLNKLKEWGVVDVGYTIEASPQTISHYNTWIENKDHLPLTYLEGLRQEKRQSLTEYWPEFKSALVFLFSYHQTHLKLQSFYQNDPDWNGLKLASYTLGFDGLDYHHQLKEHLVEIGESLKLQKIGLEYKLAMDTHPVLDRDLAMRSGLGWFGKNSMLINRHQGSFFIIGSLLLNQELSSEIQRPLETDHCGQCSSCVDACPTNAIDPVSRTVVAKDCISTFTIEQFKLESIPSEKMTLKDGFIFGCDICQDVCPWNRRIDRQNKKQESTDFSEHQKTIIDFFLKKDILELSNELETKSEGKFKSYFENTSFERSGKRGIYKNIIFYLKELKLLS